MRSSSGAVAVCVCWVLATVAYAQSTPPGVPSDTGTDAAPADTADGGVPPAESADAAPVPDAAPDAGIEHARPSTDGGAGETPSRAVDPADAVGFGDAPGGSADGARLGGDASASDAIGFGPDVGGADTGGAATPDASHDATGSTTPANDPLAGRLEASGSLAHRSALWMRRLNDHPYALGRNSLDLSARYKKPLGLDVDAPRLRLVAEGHLEYDLAYLQSHLRDDAPAREAYQTQIIGRESYVALSWGALELTFGRQIVPFGQGELLSPLDVVNPRDQREPGFAELKDLRMAVLATRAGLYVEEHRFELLVVHESYFGLRPAPLSDYNPLRKLLLEDPQARAVLAGKELRYQDYPDRFTNGAGQLYGRWSYAGSGVDLALYAGSTLDKQGVPSLPGPAALLQPDVTLPLWHPRYTMLGHAGALVLGAFVVRWEAGVDVDRPLTVRDDQSTTLALDFVRRELASGLLALTYYGITDTSVALEYAQGVVLGGAAMPGGLDLLGPVETPAAALRVTHTMLRETLDLQLVGMLLGVAPYVGSFARFELDYELWTALHWTLGYAVYAPSEHEMGPFYGFTEHDRLYSGLRWDFMLE